MSSTDTIPTISVLEDQVRQCRAALLVIPPDSADLSDTLYTLADACHAAWKLSGLEATLEEALEAYEQALELRPSGDDRRAKCLSGLGAALSAWCHFHITDIVRTRRSITLLREALRLRPPGHPLRDHSLHALGGALFFNIFEQQLGDRETLLESIPLSRQASHLRPQGHPARDRSLANLATALMRSFEHYGDVSEVAEAITINREILHRRPPGTPSRVNTLNNLGISLIHYFEHCGGFRTIAEAISLLREALKLSPAGHPRRDCALDNLARALWIYGSCQGHSNEALSEVVLLHRESLQLLPDGYPQRAITLRNLANCLLSRSRLSAQSGSRDLAEAICLLREALELQPLRDNFMFNLAEALGAQYTVKGDTSSLLEAIDLHRKALCARPHRHTLRLESLENLARLCRMPCASQSWEDTITLYREALAICPMGYPGRARLLSGMSICFLDPTSPYFNISEGISHLSNGYADKFSHINQRLSSALDDLRRVEDAHRILLEKKDASSGAQDREDILRLYNRVIGLLPHAAHYGLDHDARLHSVEGSDEIARNAAARAVHLERVSQAVELLEEGRGMFWSQSLHLRAPEFDEVPEKDRDELTRLLRLLEHGARRLENSDRTAAERERDLEARRQLNEEAETLISRIRSYPDLRRFLMPPAFISLFNALPDGYVVILNASSLGHHALLLHRTSGLAASLELSSPHQGFDSETIRAQLPRDARSKQCHMGDSTDDDRAVIFSTGRANVKTLNGLLSILWTYIARPLFDELKLQRSDGCARPGLWWCATGEFGFLPIHAAGQYQGIEKICVADFVVSSYVPTLSALSKARRGWKSIPLADTTGLLISESLPDGDPMFLPNVVDEVNTVCGCFQAVQAKTLSSHSAHTSPDELLSLLKVTSANVLHMACHGVQDSDPLKSSFRLSGGDLSIENIMQLNLSNAVLAFLSACYTARGDRNVPDQAVHLAASMLFCGFRSVIGTMWGMCDDDGPSIARCVYEYLFRNEALELDRIPYALDYGAQMLRKSGAPAWRWAPFMHMGG